MGEILLECLCQKIQSYGIQFHRYFGWHALCDHHLNCDHWFSWSGLVLRIRDDQARLASKFFAIENSSILHIASLMISRWIQLEISSFLWICNSLIFFPMETARHTQNHESRWTAVFSPKGWQSPITRTGMVRVWVICLSFDKWLFSLRIFLTRPLTESIEILYTTSVYPTD